MIKEKLPIIFGALGIIGVLWALSMIKVAVPVSDKRSDAMKNFAEFAKDELVDKCATPDGYEDAQWREHMSHHSDQYMECLSDEEKQELLDSAENSASSATTTFISAGDLSEMLENKDFFLIDVHIPEQDHIPGTDTLIPYNEIIDRQSDLPEDKNSKIVLYCRSGSMSQEAAKTLLDLGYTNVYNLTGGANEWKKAGFLTEETKM